MGRLSISTLSIWENYAQAMAVTAPLGSVVSTTTVAVAYAGKDVVLATVLAFLASAFWVYTLTIYSRRFASAGGYYSFVYAAYGKRSVAFAEAIIELFSFILLNVVNVLAVYLMVSSFLSSYSISSDLALYAVLILSLIFPTLVSFTLNIKRLLDTMVLIVATLEILVLFALFLIAARGGISFDLFVRVPEASLGNFALAFMMILVSLDGVGTATYLGEETKRPLKNVTTGMQLAFVIGGISMIAGTYAMVTLWPYGISALAEADQPLIKIVSLYGTLPAIAVILIATKSLLISNVGTTLSAARILFNLSRERAAPEIFQRVNSHGQPHVATLTVGAATALFTLMGIQLLGIRGAFIELGVATGILWILGRILSSAGAPLLLMRLGYSGHRLVAESLVPTISTIFNVLGLLISFQDMTRASATALASTWAFGTFWYFILGRFGIPGELVVDDDNNLRRIEEYISEIQKHSITNPDSA